jgi:hypothetical protein
MYQIHHLYYGTRMITQALRFGHALPNSERLLQDLGIHSSLCSDRSYMSVSYANRSAILLDVIFREPMAQVLQVLLEFASNFDHMLEVVVLKLFFLELRQLPSNCDRVFRISRPFVGSFLSLSM